MQYAVDIYVCDLSKPEHYDIGFYDELPKTNVGKILHRALRNPEKTFASKMNKNVSETLQEKKEA